MAALGFLIGFCAIPAGIIFVIYQLVKENDIANATNTNYNSISKQAELKRNERELFTALHESHARMNREREERTNNV